MTTYADMTELERVQMLGEFCGYEILEGLTPFAAQGERKKQLRVCQGDIGSYLIDGFLNIWNPFKDPTALEEVEAAIRRYKGIQFFGMRWYPGPDYFRVTLHGLSPTIDLEGFTKADALAQVVQTLGERKG